MPDIDVKRNAYSAFFLHKMYQSERYSHYMIAQNGDVVNIKIPFFLEKMGKGIDF